jgi:hypothetical protein
MMLDSFILVQHIIVGLTTGVNARVVIRQLFIIGGITANIIIIFIVVFNVLLCIITEDQFNLLVNVITWTVTATR